MLLVINQKGEIMLITRQHPKGGPPLKGFPLDEDPDTGVLGYKIGYCPHGDPLLIRTVDVNAVMSKFGRSIDEYSSWFSKLKHRTPLKHRLIKLLGGKIGE